MILCRVLIELVEQLQSPLPRPSVPKAIWATLQPLCQPRHSVKTANASQHQPGAGEAERVARARGTKQLQAVVQRDQLWDIGHEELPGHARGRNTHEEALLLGEARGARSG